MHGHAIGKPALRIKPFEYLRLRLERRLSQVVLFGVMVAAFVGWRNRERLPPPDDGLGYWLGIVGSAMMVLLLLYPLRKRLRPRHWLGSVGLWFRLHMLLGLLGPVVILYHARFGYSALNSAVAYVAMLVVACSGLTGRFIYGHIHRGYSQRKVDARELLDDLLQWRLQLEADGEAGHQVVQRLEDLEQQALAKRRTLFGNLVTVIEVGVRSRFLYYQVKDRARRRLVRDETAQHLASSVIAVHQQALQRHIYEYVRTIRELGGFVFYERMFRAWHYLHYPLFLFLVPTVILHVVAVHMY
jgi:hypothetical protein